MPGYSANHWLNLLGWGVAGLTLLGVSAHGFIRVLTRKRKK